MFEYERAKMPAQPRLMENLGFTLPFPFTASR